MNIDKLDYNTPENSQIIDNISKDINWNENFKIKNAIHFFHEKYMNSAKRNFKVEHIPDSFDIYRKRFNDNSFYLYQIFEKNKIINEKIKEKIKENEFDYLLHIIIFSGSGFLTNIYYEKDYYINLLLEIYEKQKNGIDYKYNSIK